MGLFSSDDKNMAAKVSNKKSVKLTYEFSVAEKVVNSKHFENKRTSGGIHGGYIGFNAGVKGSRNTTRHTEKQHEVDEERVFATGVLAPGRKNNLGWICHQVFHTLEFYAKNRDGNTFIVARECWKGYMKKIKLTDDDLNWDNQLHSEYSEDSSDHLSEDCSEDDSESDYSDSPQEDLDDTL